MTQPQGSSVARPRRVALTGGIASGKSYCLDTFKRLGAAVIDVDQEAHNAVAKGSQGLVEVVEEFGRSVLLPDGQLNRPALATIIFSDPAARQRLEAIIHPRVYAEVERWFAALRAPLGIAEIPLLFETSRERDFDIVIVAACKPEQQLSRLMARANITEADARARIAAQMPLADKAAKADYVIDTGGTVAQTTARTEEVWSSIATSPRQP